LRTVSVKRWVRTWLVIQMIATAARQKSASAIRGHQLRLGGVAGMSRAVVMGPV
jgi:hypothetical protein